MKSSARARTILTRGRVILLVSLIAGAGALCIFNQVRETRENLILHRSSDAWFVMRSIRLYGAEHTVSPASLTQVIHWREKREGRQDEWLRERAKWFIYLRPAKEPESLSDRESLIVLVDRKDLWGGRIIAGFLDAGWVPNDKLIEQVDLLLDQRHLYSREALRLLEMLRRSLSGGKEVTK